MVPNAVLSVHSDPAPFVTSGKSRGPGLSTMSGALYDRRTLRALYICLDIGDSSKTWVRGCDSGDQCNVH